MGNKKILTLKQFLLLTEANQLKEFEPIFESPESILPTDFNLDDNSYNKSLGKKLLKDKNLKVLKTIEEDWKLYSFPTKYAVINSSTTEIAYYMEFKIKHYELLKRTAATQIKVWRSKSFLSPTYKIARQIFFDNLLSDNDTVMTDAMQSLDGEYFWSNRIGEALEDDSLSVYYVNFIPQKNESNKRYLKKLNSWNDVSEIWKDAYGEDHKYQARRILITSKSF